MTRQAPLVADKHGGRRRPSARVAGRVFLLASEVALGGGASGCEGYAPDAFDWTAFPRGTSCPAAESAAAEPTEGGSEGVRFAVIGDYGYDSVNEARVARLVTSWKPDFVITTGDNNYFDGSAATIDANIGKHYCQFIGNYLGRPDAGSRINRFWPSPGNHDWLSPGLAPYLHYFTLPGNERYYDVVLGLIHLFAIDSDPSEPDGNTETSIQAKWLKEQLASSTACFKVVYFHHPPYSSGPHGSTLEMRWPFEAWGADVVMAGHDHVYERLAVGQIPYFTVGLGGSTIYDFVTVLPESRAQYQAAYGALRVTADRSRIAYEFMDTLGRVIDSYLSEKECP